MAIVAYLTCIYVNLVIFQDSLQRREREREREARLILLDLESNW